MLGLGSSFVSTPLGSLGATLTTAVLSVRSGAVDAFNLAHGGDGVAFSDAFLFLMLPVALALVVSSAVPGRIESEQRTVVPPAPAAPSTARVPEPSAPS
jgi:hypothetical protein